MKKTQLRKIIKESIKELMTENYTGGSCPGCTAHWDSSWCNGTMQGYASQKYLPSNMNWPQMANTGCSGGTTFNDIAMSKRTQAWAILAQYGNPGGINSWIFFGTHQGGNYNAISQHVNSLIDPATGQGIPQPHKGQLKRKAAKFAWAMKQHNDCGCIGV